MTSPIEELLVKIQTENWDKKFISCFNQKFGGMNLNTTLNIKGRWETEDM